MPRKSNVIDREELTEALWKLYYWSNILGLNLKIPLDGSVEGSTIKAMVRFLEGQYENLVNDVYRAYCKSGNE